MRSPSDWQRLFLKLEERQMLMDAFWRHQWDDEDASAGGQLCRGNTWV